MKYSIAMKIFAFVLAAVALVVTVASAAGIIALASQGLYTQEYDQWAEQFYEVTTSSVARAVAESYAARELGNLSPQELEYIGWGNLHDDLSAMWHIDEDGWTYSIYSTGGAMLESAQAIDTQGITASTHRLQVDYPVRVLGTSGKWTQKIEMWLEDGKEQVMFLEYRESPQYDVMVWMTTGSLQSFSGISLELYEELFYFRYHLIGLAAVGLLLSAAFITYLCFAAGKSSKLAGIKPGGLNRLPLDLYGLGLGIALVFLYWCFVEVAGELIFYEISFLALGLVLACCIALAAALCVIAGVFALAAQWKMGDHYVFKHSFIGWCCGKLWKLCKLGWKGLCKLYGLLPLIWKYLLVALAMALIPALFGLLSIASHYWGRAFWMLALVVALAADIAMICYGAYAYGTVLQGSKRMAEGDLRTNIDTRYLQGSYRTCAENLNLLADVAVDAAKKQMRSERMKAELVTNVSHDIKTPLTSVINYIDLLQRAESEEREIEYLEVLERQAQKLKKLIDDLMEMSKASTGDMPVERIRLDVTEAINQALGEFADKLETQELSVILRQPEQNLYVLADGRLLWRVLSNLMGNIVKYAMPGTRVYIDVEQQESKVCISLKNISKEALNISAQELTERFVRGDASRNTEGSGLGLNIAKSLMELQKGQMELTVDGDLFKVELQLNRA